MSGAALKPPEELLHENLRLVNFVLWKYFPAMARDEDLAQEGFIGLWKACLSYDGRGKFSPFAVVCIKNEILMGLRKQKRVGFTVSLDAPLDGNPDSATMEEFLEDSKASEFEVEILASDFIDRLKEQDRRILELRIAGLSQPEIAQRVSLSQSYVSRRITRIKALYERIV